MAQVLQSHSFIVLVGCVLLLLLLLKVFVHDKWCRIYSWVYLLESSLVSMFTVISARCFASLAPSPMPGQLSYFTHYPDLLYGWCSLLLLVVTAVGGLMLQNFALMHFNASEVVPVYFSMFVLSGVSASAFAFREISWPWVLLLIPGVVLCIVGVFCIAHGAPAQPPPSQDPHPVRTRSRTARDPLATRSRPLAGRSSYRRVSRGRSPASPRLSPGHAASHAGGSPSRAPRLVPARRSSHARPPPAAARQPPRARTPDAVPSAAAPVWRQSGRSATARARRRA